MKKAGRYLKENKEEVGEELADILYFVLLVSHALGIDIKESFDKKMAHNTQRFPIGPAKSKK